MRSFSSDSATPQLAHCCLQTSTLNCILETHTTQHDKASNSEADAVEASAVEASSLEASSLEASNREASKPKNRRQPTCAQTSEQSTAAGITHAQKFSHSVTEPAHAKRRTADADSTVARRLVKKATHMRKSSNAQHAVTQAAAKGSPGLHRSVSTSSDVNSEI